jgi:tetratricopeptide (TPR) repeat protein
MKRMRSFLLLTALIALIAALPAQAEVSREQALAALGSANAAERGEGAEQLARTGTMPDVEALLVALHDDDARVRALAEHAIWSVWLRSGDAEADALVRKGMVHMEAQQMGAALDAFTRAIERRPDFAEAWNKRATAYFLLGDFDQSLKDCDQVLQRNSNHFGALAGCGAIYAQREDLERALDFLQRAYELNPNVEGVEVALALVRHRLGKTGRQEI